MVSRRRITPPLGSGLSKTSAGTRRSDVYNPQEENADRTIQAVALASWENEGGSAAVELEPGASVRPPGYVDFVQKNTSFCEDMTDVVLRSIRLVVDRSGHVRDELSPV